MEPGWEELDGVAWLNRDGLPPIAIVSVILVYQEGDVSVLSSRFLQGAAVVAIGHIGSRLLLVRLPTFFPNAVFRTFFDADLPGKILSCRVALWLKGSDCAFRLSGAEVIFSYRGRSLAVPAEYFSIHRFCRLTGFRTSLRQLRKPAPNESI